MSPTFLSKQFPPSPRYYIRGGVDLRYTMSPEYWRDSATAHTFRSGEKTGVTDESDMANALACNAIWFESKGADVPYYSGLLREADAKIEQLEAELKHVRQQLEKLVAA